MKDISLTKDNDIIFAANGDLLIIYDKNTLDQRIQQALKSIRGEWFLNTELGLSYNFEFSDHKTSNITREQDIRAVLAHLSEITRINNIVFYQNYETRTLEIDINLSTIYGEMNGKY